MDIKNTIRNSIKKVIKNAIERERIASICGVSKKEVKEIINDMRTNDLEPICTTARDTKYFYPTDVDNAIEIRNKQKKAKNFKGCPNLEKYIKEESQGAIDFKDYEHDW